MPFLIRGLTRVAQLFAKSAATCASLLVEPWLQLPAGAHLMNEKGGPVVRMTELTDERVNTIWTRTREVLDRIQ
jgi:hypothetical protein